MDIDKLDTLLADPEARVVLYGLAHTDCAGDHPGPEHLHALVARVLEHGDREQRDGWLSDTVGNPPLSADQVRALFGDTALDDVARHTRSSPSDVADQLSRFLPDLVDALSPGGALVASDQLPLALSTAESVGDHESGPFAPRTY